MFTVGFIRFSFFGRNDTRLSHEIEIDKEKYYLDLYGPERMERRFHFFEKLCLPSLADQSDKDFVTVILTSRIMPKQYIHRLEALASSLQGVKLVHARGQNIHAELRSVIKQLLHGRSGRWIGFRVDDDDALARTFIETLKEMSNGVSTKTILSLSRGAHLLALEGKGYIAPRNMPFQGAGWAICQAADDYRNPFRYAHQNAAKRFPYIVNDSKISHIYCVHDYADTAERKVKRLHKMHARAQEMKLCSQFDQFRDEIEHAFPSIGYQGLLDAIVQRR